MAVHFTPFTGIISVLETLLVSLSSMFLEMTRSSLFPGYANPSEVAKLLSYAVSSIRLFTQLALVRRDAFLLQPIRSMRPLLRTLPIVVDFFLESPPLNFTLIKRDLATRVCCQRHFGRSLQLRSRGGRTSWGYVSCF